MSAYPGQYTPPVADVLQFFGYDNYPDGQARAIRERFARLAVELADTQDQTAELVVCLRALLAAMEAALRNALPADRRLPVHDAARPATLTR